LWRLVDSFLVEDVSEIAARRAGEFMRRFRRSHASIGLGDYLIAGTADTRGLELATLNVRHFPMLGRLTAPFSTPGSMMSSGY
jgi:predicted nucleic acid-binding protein